MYVIIWKITSEIAEERIAKKQITALQNKKYLLAYCRDFLFKFFLKAGEIKGKQPGMSNLINISNIFENISFESFQYMLIHI